MLSLNLHHAAWMSVANAHNPTRLAYRRMPIEVYRPPRGWKKQVRESDLLGQVSSILSKTIGQTTLQSIDVFIEMSQK